VDYSVPKFKQVRSQDVIVAGVFSPYVSTDVILGKKAVPHYIEEPSIKYLGETSYRYVAQLQKRFTNLKVITSLPRLTPTRASKGHVLPPWMFDYPADYYQDRFRALANLRELTT
jgi:hypothetical protein